ncbi:hypothetical protein JG536_12515 [Burkholderia ambifaria]|uniref:phage/plasmid replication protein, II/X family n=1 Tax=Burkholderia ambifaria TaxID=152480 RepID=UPI001589D32A|nr:phage/plasmid replication protein, II/X family [Burkholderia ambifaria]QQJ96434.1 hypothetical protein JG536_12515 [Burkholderia ambifaria]
MEDIYSKILSENFQVNIDTVAFSVTGIDVNIPDTLSALIVTPDGEIVQKRSNRKAVLSIDGSSAMQIRHRSSANLPYGELTIEGSPFAYIYGQNVWTSDSLKDATLPIILDICEKLNFTPNNETRKQWRNGNCELHRVDLAVNFQVGSENQADSALTQLKYLLASQRCQCHLHERYAALSPKNSKEYSVVAYAKGPQMRAKKSKFPDDSLYERLVIACEPLLRIEVRLRRSELRKLGLSRVCDWTEDTAKEVFSQYFKRLPLEGISYGPLSESDFEDIDDRMRPALALHMLGADWRLFYADVTRARHKAYFRKLGINLDCPHQLKHQVPLVEILSRKGAIACTPTWLIEAGMAPKPRY